MAVRTKQDIRILKHAIRRLESLMDEDDPRCSVERQHKNAVRPYLDSWVLPGLNRLLPTLPKK